MAAAAILEKFRMAISPQRLTVYLYNAHRAVIFTIAQLSCSFSRRKKHCSICPLHFHMPPTYANGHISATGDPIHFMFCFVGRVFGDGGSNVAISGSNKSKMAAAAILEKFQMAISPQPVVYVRNGSRSTYVAHITLSSL